MRLKQEILTLEQRWKGRRELTPEFKLWLKESGKKRWDFEQKIERLKREYEIKNRNN